MTLVSSRLSLIHRCTIERDTAPASTDGWEGTPVWQPHLTGLLCRWWVRDGREEVKDGQTVVPLTETRLIVPLGTDVTERDRVTSVTYRGGTVQDGPLGIRAVLVRRDRIELALTEVG